MFKTVCIIHRILDSMSHPQMPDKTYYTKWRFEKGILKNPTKTRRMTSHYGKRYRIYIYCLYICQIQAFIIQWTAKINLIHPFLLLAELRKRKRERVRKCKWPYNTSVVKTHFSTIVVKTHFDTIVVKTHFNTRVVKTHFNTSC